MERADDPRGAQPALAHPRMRMRADIVERIHTLAGMADDDLAARKGHGAHAALGNVGQGYRGLEIRIAHFGGRVQVREGAL